MEYVSAIDSKASTSTKRRNLFPNEENKFSSGNIGPEKISYTEALSHRPKTTVNSEVVQVDKGPQREVQTSPTYRGGANGSNSGQNYTDALRKSPKNQIMFSENVSPKLQQYHQADAPSPHSLKISEAILHDPILSKIVKNMYEKQKIGHQQSRQVPEQKFFHADRAKASEIPHRKFPFLSPSLEEVLEKVIIYILRLSSMIFNSSVFC